MRGSLAMTALLAATVAYPSADRCSLKKKCQAVACPTEQCDGGYLKPNASHCGCCAKCIRLLDRGDRCIQTFQEEAACSAGLECSEKTGTCVPSVGAVHKPPDNSPPPPCGSTEQMPWNSPSKCSWDGTYSPRQCSVKYCMCVTPDGMVLPYKQLRKHEEKMECVCARVEHAISQFWSQRHQMCDPFGNYRISASVVKNNNYTK